MRSEVFLGGLIVLIILSPIFIYLRRRGVSQRRIVGTMIFGGLGLFVVGLLLVQLSGLTAPTPDLRPGHYNPVALQEANPMRWLERVGGFAAIGGMLVAGLGGVLGRFWYPFR